MLVNDLIGSNRKAIKLEITKKLLDNVYSLGRMFRKLYTKQYVYITLFLSFISGKSTTPVRWVFNNRSW